jgi:hypothetical protein
MTRNTGLVTAVAMMVALGASAAEAQEAEGPTDPIARAQELFAQGTEAYDQHHYATAARLFREVHSLMDGHPRQYLVLFNLGQCLMDAGIYVEAIEVFLAYLEAGGDRVENRGEVDQKIARIREIMGAGDDGDDTGPPVPAPIAPAPRGPDEGLMAGAIASLAVGGVGFLAMGIFGGLALAEHQSLSDGCGATTSCAPEDIATSDTFALVADIALGVGAAGIATGIVLLVVALSGGDEEPATALVPWMTPNGAGGAWSVRW